jgi:hypothetical protein
MRVSVRACLLAGVTLRGTGDQAPPDETAEVPSAGDNTADAEVETESAATPEPTGEDTEANPDNVDAGSE